jgi:hypothetical protein
MSEIAKFPVGWFESAEQVEPSHDPGLDVPCPVCGLTLTRPMKTISLMVVGGAASYFFRAHKPCWDSASEEERCQIESTIIDGIATGSR